MANKKYLVSFKHGKKYQTVLAIFDSKDDAKSYAESYNKHRKAEYLLPQKFRIESLPAKKYTKLRRMS